MCIFPEVEEQTGSLSIPGSTLGYIFKYLQLLLDGREKAGSVGSKCLLAFCERKQTPALYAGGSRELLPPKHSLK